MAINITIVFVSRMRQTTSSIDCISGGEFWGVCIRVAGWPDLGAPSCGISSFPLPVLLFLLLCSMPPGCLTVIAVESGSNFVLLDKAEALKDLSRYPTSNVESSLFFRKSVPVHSLH
jgi:hypothetical protein